MKASASNQLMRELLRDFRRGTWHSVKSHEPPACPEIPASLTMDVDDGVATVTGPGWSEKGSLIAAHSLLDRVWDRLGWPTLRDFRITTNDHLRAHGWEDSVYEAIAGPLLELSEGWPPERRARLLAALHTHRSPVEDVLKALAERVRPAAVFLEEDATLTADVFEGQRKRSWIKLLERSAQLFSERTTLSRYALLRAGAAYATGASAPPETIIKRATPLLVTFDPLDEIAIGSQTVREAVACYALTHHAVDLALPHLDVLLEQRRNHALNSFRRAHARMFAGDVDLAYADFAVFESAVLRLAELSGDRGWKESLLWAKADWLLAGPFGAAARRDGIVPFKEKARPPAPTLRDHWEKKRRELLEPALAAFLALPQKWVFRFSAYHLRLPLSDIEARLRAGNP